MDIRYQKELNIPVGKTILKGDLILPEKADSIILFSHGSGSSRVSKRNKMVAHYLQEMEFGTLLFDLLTEEEDMEYRNRFDIELITSRLIGATEWLEKLPSTLGCRLAYFGASTGAASALKAASVLPQIQAVVSRGGRPDLAMKALAGVKAPTLFIVGSLDQDVLRLNKEAYAQLNCEKKLEVIEGASHLFEEKGKMDEVCIAAGLWFETHLHPVIYA
ncbi:MAG: dienelactone hydrolase family protein [Saprospiraceae bacterium]